MQQRERLKTRNGKLENQSGKLENQSGKLENQSEFMPKTKVTQESRFESPGLWQSYSRLDVKALKNVKVTKISQILSNPC